MWEKIAMSRYPRDLKRMTICKCPKCERSHWAKLFWTGRGTPRVYCHECRFHSIVNEFTYDEPHKVGIEIYLHY